MPRNVRNFWVTVSTTDSTRSKPVSTGPASKDGGFDINIKIRKDGNVSCNEVRIKGRCTADGMLMIEADSDLGIILSDSGREAILLTGKR